MAVEVRPASMSGPCDREGGLIASEVTELLGVGTAQDRLDAEQE